MKIVNYKKRFKSVEEALVKVPNELKVNENVFKLSDGNKTIKARWEGTLTEGKAVALLVEDKELIAEDMSHMKHLMGYKSEKTIGTPKAENRVLENDKFRELLSETKKKALNENDLSGFKEINYTEEKQKGFLYKELTYSLEDGKKYSSYGKFDLNNPSSALSLPNHDNDVVYRNKDLKNHIFSRLSKGNQMIGEEAELLDEGMLSNFAKVAAMIGMSLASFQAMAQESPEKAVATVKNEVKKLSPEQLKDIADATGIEFTSDAANQLFDFTPAKKFEAANVPELYLGKYGDIKAAKVIKTGASQNGGYVYTVQLNSMYGSSDNFGNVRTYLGKNNKKLKNSTIRFVNQDGSHYGGKDINYK